MMQRYRMAFLSSSLVFISFWAIYLNLPPVEKNLKEIQKKVIQISIVKKIEEKKLKVKVAEVKPVIIPQPIIPIVQPKKVVTKPKKIIKKVIKKVIKKPKRKPKKIVKKVKPKKIIKKVVPKAKKIVKKAPPKKIVKKVKPIEPEIYYAPQVVQPKTYYEPPIIEPEVYYKPQPIIKAEPIIQREVYTPSPELAYIPQATIQTAKPIINNGQAKKAFLRNVRSKLIANKKYPKIAKRRHIEGSVKVRFDISARGYVSNIRFISGKRIFHKSIRKSLERTFPMGIPDDVKAELPISDVSVTLHFNIR